VIATVPPGLGSPVGGFDVWRDGRMVETLFQGPATPAAPPPAPALTVIFNAIGEGESALAAYRVFTSETPA